MLAGSSVPITNSPAGIQRMPGSAGVGAGVGAVVAPSPCTKIARITTPAPIAILAQSQRPRAAPPADLAQLTRLLLVNENRPGERGLALHRDLVPLAVVAGQRED